MSQIVKGDGDDPRRELTADAPWGFFGRETGQLVAVVCTWAVEVIAAEGQMATPPYEGSEWGLGAEDAGGGRREADEEGRDSHFTSDKIDIRSCVSRWNEPYGIGHRDGPSKSVEVTTDRGIGGGSLSHLKWAWNF